MAIISPQQILVPKKVYIGDLAELRCTFNNPDANLKTLTANGKTELSLVSLPSEDYDIKSISISPAGVDFYQLTITFIPWKTGDIQFPPLNIDDSELVIEFQPVQIVSLVSTDTNNTTTLRDAASPLLLPGTAYKLYGALTLVIILLIIILRIIIKRKSILFYLDTKRLQRKYKRNKKQTLRALHQILQEEKNKQTSSQNDALIAEKLQKLLRNYLEVRFDYPFTRAATSELMTGWQKASGGLLSDEKTEAFGDIAGVFIRTDFIRYSKDAIFNKSELSDLIKQITERIEVLENEENNHA